MKRTPEYIEAPIAGTRFEQAMKAVVAVPHAEIQRRIEEHKKQAALNPHKRGPKPKASSAFRAPRV